MPNKAVLDIAVAGLIIGFLVATGIIIGFLIWGQQVETVTEWHATPIQMADGSVVVSREPGAKPTVPDPEKPKGTTVVRTIEATVNGGGPVLKPIEAREPKEECYSAQDFTCPPVTVRIDLLRDDYGTYRAQVSSNTGEVLDGVDIPREPVQVLVQRKWVAGYERRDDGRSGIFVARDVGRIQLGASATQDSLSGRIGWRF